MLAAFSVIIGGLAMAWVLWLQTYAYRHRDEYDFWADRVSRTGVASATAPPPGAATKDTKDTAHDTGSTETAPSGGGGGSAGKRGHPSE